MRTVKFRYNAAVSIAGLVAFLGAVPFGASRWYFAPILLVPMTIAVWGWRAGTDASADGLRLRALAGSRRIAWPQVAQLAADHRGRVHAALQGGGSVRLPAVRAADLPRLVAASGQELTVRT